MPDFASILTQLKVRLLGPPKLPDTRPPWRDARAGSGGLRIQLGCGRDCWPGYVNVDIDPASPAEVHSHFLPYLESLGEDAADEIAMIHSLSYLRLAEARALFGQVRRVLRRGGVFVVEFPDLAKCARNLLRHRPADTEAYLKPVMGMYAFDAEMVRENTPYVPYAFGWSAGHLAVELERAGFVEVRILPPQSPLHDRSGRRDSRVEAMRPKR